MRESSPEAPELDARLAEIDRRLRAIQGELAPDQDALAEPPEPETPVATRDLDDQIAQLTALNASLLSSMTEVLAQLQAALAHASAPPEVSVSAGPLHSLDAVRAFERELVSLPGVRQATVRGYEGDDRAVIDVQLSPMNT